MKIIKNKRKKSERVAYLDSLCSHYFSSSFVVFSMFCVVYRDIHFLQTSPKYIHEDNDNGSFIPIINSTANPGIIPLDT